MSNPDPQHDPENEREDDDLRRTQEDAERYERTWQEYLAVNKAFMQWTRQDWSINNGRSR